jgi:hypothetical protein
MILVFGKSFVTSAMRAAYEELVPLSQAIGSQVWSSSEGYLRERTINASCSMGFGSRSAQALFCFIALHRGCLDLNVKKKSIISHLAEGARRIINSPANSLTIACPTGC